MSVLGISIVVAVVAFAVGFLVGNDKNDTDRSVQVQFWRDEFETAASEADLLRQWITKGWPKWMRDEHYRRLMDQVKRTPRCDCYCRRHA